jgi:hypothetical protein
VLALGLAGNGGGYTVPILGGFKVSNFIGIKRRMIDMGKKIIIFYLQNVKKCTVFSHLHLKFPKSAIMTRTNFFLKNINMSNQKTQNIMLISNWLKPRLMYSVHIYGAWASKIIILGMHRVFKT